MIIPDSFIAPPAVYSVGNEYQIFIAVNRPMVMWVKTGNDEYYDDSNGVLRSGKMIHRITVPMSALDCERQYKLCFREVFERLDYFSKTGDMQEATFPFRPVRGETVRMYMIADTHSRVNAPIQCGRFFGNQLDLLILNGDLPDSSREINAFTAIHRIAGEITGGEIPVVFARGNHDLRGVHAEDMADFTPTRNGFSYFTFRLGPVWGIVLDCGEDKPDDHEEYGFTNCCHAFRKRETDYLRQVIRQANSEYAADGIKYRLTVCHMPFSFVNHPPFDIEQDIYRQWCSLLKKEVKPDLMLSGHEHKYFISLQGSEFDHLGQPCPVVVGSKPGADYSVNIGTAVDFEPEGIRVRFTDQNHQILEDENLPLAKR